MSPFGSIQHSKLSKSRVICLLRGMEDVSVEDDHASWWLWCLLESSKGLQVDVSLFPDVGGTVLRFPWISRQTPCSSIFLKGLCSKIHQQVQTWPEYSFNPTPQEAREDSCCLVPICACFFMWLFSFSYVCVWHACISYACLFIVGATLCEGTNYVCACGDPRLMLEIFPNCSSTLFNKGEPLSEPRTHWWSSSH